MSLWQADEERFYQVHGQLADYFAAQSNRKVPPDSPSPAKYENPDWREQSAEFLYHLLFTERTDCQAQFRAHLLEARYLREDDVVKIPLQAITAEVDLAEHPFLTYTTRKFLTSIKPAVEYGWAILQQEPIDYEQNRDRYNLSKAQVDLAVKTCLQPADSLDGLAKFAALFYQSKRCLENQRFSWLMRAKAQAEKITTAEDPEFSSGLFLWKIGNALDDLGRKEEAIASYDQALAIQPDYHQAWYNRGVALSALGHKEEAITSYDQALVIQPDTHQAWNNRGVALSALGRKEEAIASYDQALAIQPDYHQAWYNRGVALSALGRKEEAI
ncbi:MAG: tetratricopeptide repeat protein, partial [Cyanothece sp. SIO1E1]|nr:tetratricopeptide repeat protein [Cyanothece sp. SIO1E1]